MSRITSSRVQCVERYHKTEKTGGKATRKASKPFGVFKQQTGKGQ